MIRRDTFDRRGQPAWVLISQVDHARLAERVAAVWGAGGFLPVEPRDEALAAIRVHDDGWAAWEANPQVDAASGRPLDFMEMPHNVAFGIWQGSIDVAERIGPLPALMVASHFAALLRRYDSWRRQGTEQVALAEAFLARQDRACAAWLERWREHLGLTKAVAEAKAARAVADLQWFDRLSLWFCCAERRESDTLDTPDGPLTLAPATAGELRLSPWPLFLPALDLSVPGRQVPVARYDSAEALAAAPSEMIKLHWRLCPAS